MRKITRETRIKISRALIGNKNSLGTKRTAESRAKMSAAQMGNQKGLGHRKSEEYKRFWSEKRRGKNGSNWKGGLTPKIRLIRHSAETGIWRKSVFKRDNWTCRKYGIRGGRLHAHHIKNFAQYPNLRFNVENGVTLSVKAHREFHKKYGKINNTEEQLKEFLKS